MPFQRRMLGLGAIVGAVLLAGCYGSTEPATNIGLDEATLNANGNTQGSRTVAWFEYWTGSRSSGVSTTPMRSLPANVQGPFRERVVGLSVDKDYSFRLCGKPEETDGAGICAQTRAFRTLPGDEVTAVFEVGARLHAVSGPHGETARGFLAVDGNQDPPQSQDVVCLSVHGSEAVVGTRSAGSSSVTLYGLRAGINTITLSPGHDPTSCAAYRPGDLPATTLRANATIHDSP